MTTGRINQVAARALRHCSWARLTRAAHSFIPNGLPLPRIFRSGTSPPRISDLRFTLSTYRLACAHNGENFPAAHAPMIRPTSGGFSLPVTLMMLSLASLGSKDLPCASKKFTGPRGLLAYPCEDFCLGVWGGAQRSSRTFSAVSILTNLPLIYVSANRTCINTQNKEIHKIFVYGLWAKIFTDQFRLIHMHVKHAYSRTYRVVCVECISFPYVMHYNALP